MSFIVIDVETTGLDCTADRIIEIGLVSLDEDLRIENQYHTLVNPERAISGTEIHHISDEMVSAAPTFAQVAQHIMQLCDGRIFVGHNISFDLGFLNAELARIGISAHLDRQHAVCTMDQSRIYCSPGPHALTKLTARLGIEMPVSHRALTDTLAAVELLRVYVNREQAGQRYTDLAHNRAGDSVYPHEWLRALPWNQPE